MRQKPVEVRLVPDDDAAWAHKPVGISYFAIIRELLIEKMNNEKKATAASLNAINRSITDT